MSNSSHIRSFSTILILILILVSFSDIVASEKSYNIAFIEAGESPENAAFRSFYTRWVTALAPDSMNIMFSPAGFKSAKWSRSISKELASEISNNANLDLVVALGPWVVQDLLDSGCKIPIVAARQFDPAMQGLLDSKGHPIVDNLTVRIKPGKIESDIALIANMLEPKRIGLIYFPSGDEHEAVVSRFQGVASKYGIEVLSAQGFNVKGTFAVFKAYAQLKDSVDIIYLPALWAVNPEMENQFFLQGFRDNIPIVTGEGEQHVKRGAVLSGNAEAVQTNAYYHAWKTIKILSGAKPSELSFQLEEQRGIVAHRLGIERYDLTFPERFKRTATIIEKNIPRDEQLFLHEAVEQSLFQSPDYLAQVEAISEAVFAAKRVASGYMPQLDLNASIDYLDENARHNRFNEVDRYALSAQVLLQQTVLSFEKLSKIRVSKRKSDILENSQLEARNNLELAVTLSYLTRLRTEDYLKQAIGYTKRIGKLLQLLRLKQTLGEDMELDILRWRVEMKRSEREVINAEVGSEIAIVIFNSLLNLPSDSIIFLDRSRFSDQLLKREYVQLLKRFGSEGLELESEDFLVRSALKTNPSLAGYDIRRSLESIFLSQNRSRYYPTIGFKASFAVRDSLRNTSSFKESSTEWGIGATLKLPLFSGGDRKHEREMIRTRLSKTEFKKDAEILRVITEVRSESRRLVAALESFPIIEDELSLTKAINEEAYDDYISGKLRYLELLDLERSLFTSRVNKLRIRHNFWESAAKLLHVIGWTAFDKQLPPSVTILTKLQEEFGKN